VDTPSCCSSQAGQGLARAEQTPPKPTGGPLVSPFECKGLDGAFGLVMVLQRPEMTLLLQLPANESRWLHCISFDLDEQHAPQPVPPPPRALA
jgi:hypothetical protein